MALSIPNTIKPGKNSFPTSPKTVREWLTGIQPLRDNKSIKVLYRGLKHSNRLENSARNRLEIADMLEPPIRSALSRLEEHFLGQSLPLPKKSAQARSLYEAILAEQAITWKLVVNDTYASLLPGQGKTRAVGIYKSLRCLSKLIECHLSMCSPLPAKILEDGNTLFQFALKSNLTDSRNPEENISGRNEWSIENAFCYMSLLSLFDSRYQRLRQIPLVCDYLADNASLLSISSIDNLPIELDSVFGVFLDQDSKPIQLDYVNKSDDANLAVIDLAPLIAVIDKSIGQQRNNRSYTLENETVSSTALVNLKNSFEKNRKRKSARAIILKSVNVEIGLQNIVSLFRYEEDIPYRYPESPLSARKNVHWPIRTIEAEGSWSIINKSLHGLCLKWKGRGTTNTNTGEPVVIRVDSPNATRQWRVGLVRWMQLVAEDELHVGIEFIPGKKVSATHLGNPDDEQNFSERGCLIVQQPADSEATGELVIAPANVFSQGAVLETDSLDQYELIGKTAYTQAVDIFTVTQVPTDLSKPAIQNH